MCGIAGVITERGIHSGHEAATALTMASLQRHRGPDGAGVWSAPGVALAAARLAITGDGSRGRQPVIDRAGGVLVLNGEIYNLRALGAGGLAEGASDTDALALALARRGSSVLPELNGPFALARYDPSTGHLLLARDRVGKKPLYLARTATGWAFASTITALHFATGPLRVRPEAIDEYLVFRSVGGHHSAFAGVEQVAPGSWLELGPDGVVGRGRYWRPSAPVDLPRSPADVRGIVDRAVAARADDAREVAVFISGGLDSAIVAQSLRRQRPDQALRLISAGYDAAGPEDERPFALRIGATLGVRHDEVIVHGEQDAPELMTAAARLLEDPVQDPVTLPTLALARAASEFTRVVLTGDGSDELWGGYARFDDAPQRLDDYWPRAAIFLPEEIGLAGWPATYLDGVELPDAGADPLERILRVEIANRMRNYHLSRIDKLVMGSAVEVRCPFLDPAVIDAAMLTPARVKRPGGRPKGLLTDAFRGDLPSWLSQRRKQPFSVPIRGWLAGGLSEFARDMLLSVDSYAAAIMDPAPLFAQVAAAPEIADPAAARLWSLLQLEVWHREVARPMGRDPLGNGQLGAPASGAPVAAASGTLPATRAAARSS